MRLLSGLSISSLSLSPRGCEGCRASQAANSEISDIDPEESEGDINFALLIALKEKGICRTGGGGGKECEYGY
jgi:hypothetical protein